MSDLKDALKSDLRIRKIVFYVFVLFLTIPTTPTKERQKHCDCSSGEIRTFRVPTKTHSNMHIVMNIFAFIVRFSHPFLLTSRTNASVLIRYARLISTTSLGILSSSSIPLND